MADGVEHHSVRVDLVADVAIADHGAEDGLEWNVTKLQIGDWKSLEIAWVTTGWRTIRCRVGWADAEAHPDAVRVRFAGALIEDGQRIDEFDVDQLDVRDRESPELPMDPACRRVGAELEEGGIDDPEIHGADGVDDPVDQVEVVGRVVDLEFTRGGVEVG